MNEEFGPGDRVPRPGVYSVAHRNGHRANHEVLLLTDDDTFPPCRECGEQVRFRLVLHAPHVLHDRDFEEQQNINN